MYINSSQSNLKSKLLCCQPKEKRKNSSCLFSFGLRKWSILSKGNGFMQMAVEKRISRIFFPTNKRNQIKQKKTVEALCNS